MLDEILFYDTLRQAMWVAVTISIPVLTAALVAGLVIGLFQALTSIQEMTLTFVPKVLAIVGVFWITMGFMTDTLVGFFQNQVIALIVAL